MSNNFLNQILEKKRRRVDELKSGIDLPTYYSVARAVASQQRPSRLLDALTNDSRTNIIAEFKRASPSKGLINESLMPADAARAYENGGAAAISVLTEEDHFHGTLDDLREIKAAVRLPILRKDFVVDEYQIYESSLAGADAVLLIVPALSAEQLRSFLNTAASLHLDTIVEVHNDDELAAAAAAGARIIGVNNRDLKSFTVSLDVSRSLIKQKPAASIMIAESGLSSIDEIIELRGLGYSAFLIGETLMRSEDPEAAVRTLVDRTQAAAKGSTAADGL